MSLGTQEVTVISENGSGFEAGSEVGQGKLEVLFFATCEFIGLGWHRIGLHKKNHFGKY